MSKETRNSEFSRKTSKIKTKRGANKASDGQNTAAQGHAQGKSAHLTPKSGSKSGQRRSKPAPLSKTPPNRARGTHQISATSAPRSPKQRDGHRDTDNMSRNSRHKSGNNQGNNRGGGREGGAMWIWGVHAVMAVLNNPKRTLHALMMTESAAARLDIPKNAPLPKIVLPNVMDKQFPSGTVHQGIAVKVAPLEWPDISDIAAPKYSNAEHSDPEHSDPDGLILVLDQITDPHNVGAMLRLCSAFGVRALVMQDRKAPPMAGATAKVAVGCLETVPVCLVKNIANTLQDLKKQNWMVTGLAGETDKALSSALKGSGNKVIVMGAEGPGLRPRVRACCDWLARIPMLSSDVHGEAESLNVATAAGIALYEARRD